MYYLPIKYDAIKKSKKKKRGLGFCTRPSIKMTWEKKSPPKCIHSVLYRAYFTGSFRRLHVLLESFMHRAILWKWVKVCAESLLMEYSTSTYIMQKSWHYERTLLSPAGGQGQTSTSYQRSQSRHVQSRPPFFFFFIQFFNIRLQPSDPGTMQNGACFELIKPNAVKRTLGCMHATV